MSSPISPRMVVVSGSHPWAVLVVVLAGVPLAGAFFVPSASDQWYMNQTTSFQLLAKGYVPYVGPSDGYEKSYITVRISIRNN